MNIIKKLLCMTAAAAVATGANADVVNAYAVDPLTSDMALVYMGNQTRPVWNQASFRPMVVHTYSDGSQPTWMFDSFLFLETSFENKYLYNRAGGEAQASTQALWEKLFRFQLGISHKGQGVDAINTMIETLKKTLGEPAIKHKIVIQLPTPQDNQTNWGTVNGKSLNFKNEEDMQTAMRWGVDKILELWNQGNYKNLELVGVYCIDESMKDVADRFRSISNYLHEKGLKLYWIPYYNNNPSKNQWAENGVDVAYQQPNYYFDKNIYKSRLRAAIDDAKKYGLGLELEFHPDALWNYRRTTSETDMTIPSKESFYTRLQDYIDEFEAKGVFDESAIAYYSGNDGFSQFARSTTPEDLAIMDRLAHIIDNRHKKLAGVNDITADESVMTFAVGGYGFIHVPEGFDSVTVYTINGVEIHRGTGTVYCPTGLYIATDGKGHSVKLAVK